MHYLMQMNLWRLQVEFEIKVHKMGTGFFQAKFLDPKTGKRRRKRFSTLKDAKLYKKQMEDRVNSKGKHAFTELRVAQAMQTFLEKFPDTHVRGRKNHFIHFIETFSAHKVTEITTSDLKQWIESRGRDNDLSEKTLSGISSQFFGFFEFLVDENYMQVNPIRKVKFNRHAPPRRTRTVLSIDEVLQILDDSKKFSPEVLYPYLSCVAHTGARRSEIVNLNREDIDFNTNLIHLKKTKNGRERFVKISPMLEVVLRDQLASHPYTPLFVTDGDKRLNNQGELARLITKFKEFFPTENKEGWGSHSLRHSFAYNFLKKGGKMYQLQAILGHRSIDVTVDLYGQLQAQDIECPSPYEPTKTKED